MKRKILLLMLTLGFLGCISAQTTRGLGYTIQQHPSPYKNHVQIKQTENAKNPINGQINARKAKTNEPEVDVHITLTCDTEQQLVESVVFANSQNYINYNAWFGDDVHYGLNSFSVPSGTYDIIAVFEQKDPNDETLTYNKIFVIHEQVEINGNEEFYFSADEATNQIHFPTLTIDGEPVYTGKWSVDKNWNWTCLEEGNCDIVEFFSLFSNLDYGDIYLIGGDYGVDAVGQQHSTFGDHFSVFHVNDVSERFKFSTYRIIYEGHSIYTSFNEVMGASGDVTTANDPSDYALFETTLKLSQYEQSDNYFGFEYSINDGLGHCVVLPGIIAPEETCKFYIGAKMDDIKSESVPVFLPYLYTTVFDENEIPSYEPIMSIPPLFNIGGNVVLGNNGISSHHNVGLGFTPYLSDEYNPNVDSFVWYYPRYQSNPIFSYPYEKIKGEIGNNCPMLVCSINQYLDPWISYYCNNYSYDYVGRYGENRPDDLKDANIQILFDGENVYDGPGPVRAFSEEPMIGDVDVSITLENLEIGDMTGSNIAHIHYTAGSQDQTPPTMQLLHFKDCNGDVTERFNTASDAILELYAGDFNSFWNNYSEYLDRQIPESVEVSYSPYGEDNWNEVPVEEVPEYYWPVTGYFYRGSLAGVTGEAYEGWFDLKIKLTDAAGNWQEQVLSPAFRIDDLAYSSVATITSAGKSGDNAIYNLAGQRMRGELNTLSHGIYIVNGKKVVK